MKNDLKRALLEVVSKGLSPEDAALLLLEPSRWERDLFSPTSDLKTIYQSYLRGELGIGRVFDAAADIASAADSMAEIADSVSRNYGHDARPDDVPDEVAEENRIPAEDTEVEVLQVAPDGITFTIIDSIMARFPASLLEQVFPAPSGAPTDASRLMQSFEQGHVVDRSFRSIEKIVGSLLPQLEDAWIKRDWRTVLGLYEQLQQEASGLAGDIMVMNQVANAVVDAGMGDSLIPSQAPLARGEQLEAWSPTALGSMFRGYTGALHHMLSKANLGNLSYAELQRITDQASGPDSPIMSFVDADIARDIAGVRRMQWGEPQAAAPEGPAVRPSAAVAGGAPVQEPLAPAQPEPTVPAQPGPAAPEVPTGPADQWDASVPWSKALQDVTGFSPDTLQTVLGNLRGSRTSPEYLMGAVRKMQTDIESQFGLAQGLGVYLKGNPQAARQFKARLRSAIRALFRKSAESGRQVIDDLSEVELVGWLRGKVAVSLPSAAPGNPI